jgi:hypothetical protein
MAPLNNKPAGTIYQSASPLVLKNPKATTLTTQAVKIDTPKP